MTRIKVNESADLVGLDGLVELARSLRREDGFRTWMLGRLLDVVVHHKLYRPRFRNFESFCASAGFTRIAAAYFIRLAAQLTPMAIGEMGIAKSILVCRLPSGPERDELLLRAPGMTRNELDRAVREAKKKKGEVENEQG